MPCDSPAAGLISLGALIRDLKNPRANAFHGHAESIKRYAEQFLGHCKDCQFDPCNPELKNCGYIKESTGFLRHKNKKKYRISERTKLEDNLHHTAEHWLYVNQKGGHWSQHRRYILNWHIHDEPPAHLEKNEGALSTEVYSKIIDEIINFSIPKKKTIIKWIKKFYKKEMN